MRGYPDISVNGVNCGFALPLPILSPLLSARGRSLTDDFGLEYADVVVVDGTFQLIYGTSASAPVAGAMFALINDARAAAGKKPIGFVNQVLYANPSMFHDVQYGSNRKSPDFLFCFYLGLFRLEYEDEG